MITRRNLPRIIIADDHTLVAEACKKLLESDYEIVATVGDGQCAQLGSISAQVDVGELYDEATEHRE